MAVHFFMSLMAVAVASVTFLSKMRQNGSVATQEEECFSSQKDCRARTLHCGWGTEYSPTYADVYDPRPGDACHMASGAKGICFERDSGLTCLDEAEGPCLNPALLPRPVGAPCSIGLDCDGRGSCSSQCIISTSNTTVCASANVFACLGESQDGKCCGDVSTNERAGCYKARDARCFLGHDAVRQCYTNEEIACIGLSDLAQCSLISGARGKCHHGKCMIGVAAGCIGKSEGQWCDNYDDEHMNRCPPQDGACSGPFVIAHYSGGTCYGIKTMTCKGAIKLGETISSKYHAPLFSLHLLMNYPTNLICLTTIAFISITFIAIANKMCRRHQQRALPEGLLETNGS